jgi:hypothetical protein
MPPNFSPPQELAKGIALHNGHVHSEAVWRIGKTGWYISEDKKSVRLDESSVQPVDRPGTFMHTRHKYTLFYLVSKKPLSFLPFH